VKRVIVTGAAGQIAYSLLFRLASGEVFGNQEPISLAIVDVPEMTNALQGVAMELQDCAFPLLHQLEIGSDVNKIFSGAEYVFLIGAKPRGPGMERKDLLLENAKIFVEQGKALDFAASQEVTVLVVGNPCNTNCLIARHFARRIDPNRFFAMTMLDENRARAVLAQKAKVGVEKVSPVPIFGNHSLTQVPDFFHASIEGKPVLEVLKHEESWLKNDFFSFVQKRGAEVIAARGKSSAASAASAALDAMRSVIGLGNEELFSMGVSSNANPYGIAEGLIFSFGCRFDQKTKAVKVVEGWTLDPFLIKKLQETEKELLEEKKMIEHLLT
jgi:malate dehydrogenase